MPYKWKEFIFQILIQLDMPLFNFIKNCLKMSSYSFMRWPQGNCEPSSNHVHIFDRQKFLIQWFIFDLMSQTNVFWYDWKRDDKVSSEILVIRHLNWYQIHFIILWKSENKDESLSQIYFGNWSYFVSLGSLLMTKRCNNNGLENVGIWCLQGISKYTNALI